MITFIRKNLLNAYAALPLLLCFLMTSWSSFGAQNNHTKMTFLSGKDMFRGVFFLEGQYAQMLPEAQAVKTAYLNQNQSASQRAAVAQVRQTILERIESSHAGYFAHFKAVLKSGDAVRVSQALAQGEQLVAQALDELYHVDKAQLAKLQAQAEAAAARQGGKLDAQAVEKLVSQIQKGKALDVNSGTCLVTVLAVVILLWVVIALAAEELALDNKPSSHSLLHEQIVASICHIAPQIV